MKEKARKKAKRKKLTGWLTLSVAGGIILVLAVLFFLLMGGRVEALEKFGSKADNANQLLELIENGLSDQSVTVTNLGTIGDKLDETVYRMSSPTQFFVIANPDGRVEFLTIQNLIEFGLARSDDAEVWREVYSKQLLNSINGKWIAYEIMMENMATIIAIDEGSKQVAGVLTSLSRRVSSAHGHSHYAKKCSLTLPLTYYIWGEYAETIKICMEAQCSGVSPISCDVIDAPTSTGWFAEVEIDPRPSFQGEVRGDLCLGRARIEVKYLVGAVKLKIIEAALGRAFTRSVEASLDCAGNLTADFLR